MSKIKSITRKSIEEVGEVVKIKTGQIWQVITKDFWSSEKGNLYKKLDQDLKNRKVRINLNQGEFIEIRYPYEWHYRTEDSLYLHSESQDILKHCRLYGIIHENIQEENKKNLKEILQEELYTPIWEMGLDEND